MATLLTEAHIQAQARLRHFVATAVLLIWQGLQSYDERDIDPFLARAVPVVLGGQRQAVALTEAYLAQSLRRAPLGVSPDALIGAAVRNGTPPEEVYRRPFVNVWTALKNGSSWEDAVHSGQARATSSAQMDAALSSRATFQAVQESDDGIYGYRRVADSGACKFCRTVNGAYVKSGTAFALHSHCGCSLQPLTSPHSRAKFLPSGASVEEHYAQHEHGELGLVLTDPTHHFEGPSVVNN